MSGIAGIFYLDDRPVEREQLGRMVEVLAHRGPDGSATWSSGSVGLGHRMLHATPESLHEQSPYIDQTGNLVLTADARIDNRNELITKLKLRQPQHRPITDSELILAAYEKWGEACPEKLLGAFAFALWDSRERQLFCARDHSGIKPFYYYHVPGKLFVFASEIKALLALEYVPKELNEVRIAQHMLMPVREDATRTFYKDIRGIAPAHTIIVRSDKLRRRCYWSLDPTNELRLSSDAAYAEALREIFTKAVKCRLRGVNGVGSMLSGGLDSSSVTCMAAYLANQRNGSGKAGRIHTFSAVFDDVPKSDEQSFIKAVLTAYDLEPHFFQADQVSPLHNVVDMLRYQDRAIEAGNLYINWNLYQMAGEQGIRVMLDGFDGDTTLSHGRFYPVELAKAGRWLTLVSEVKAHAQNLNQPWKPVVRAWLWQQGVRPLISKWTPLSYTYRAWRALIRRARSFYDDSSSSAGGCSWKEVLNDAFIAGMESYMEEKPGPPSTEREHHYGLLMRALMPKTLELLDATAAAHSIEVRLPFFDKRLIEFCLSLPADQKMQGGWTRLVMRRAMEGVLPEKIQWRPDKSDLGPSFKHGLLAFERDRLMRVTEGSLGNIDGYVNRRVLREALQQYGRGAGNGDLLLWRALSLGLWLQHITHSQPQLTARKRR